MKLEDMSWDEALEKCKGRIILVPHGSTEEHGYHLPLKTDALIAEKACEAFWDSKNVVVAPVMKYTGLKSTKQMPGTVGPDADGYELWLREIISDFLKLEPKKVFFFLGHDGQTQRIVLGKLKKEFGEVVEYLDSSSLSQRACEARIIESRGHAGEGETSQMLYLDPKHVKMSKAVDELWPQNWQEAGISKSGVNGKPTKATAAKGKKLHEFYRKELAKALK